MCDKDHFAEDAEIYEKRGLVTRIRSYPLPDGTVAEQMFLAPPLVITEQQVDRILEIVRASIKAVLPTQP